MPTNQHIDLESTDEVRAIEPITLPEMDSIKLMNRIDSKYLTNEDVLLAILRDAHAEGYRALVVEGKKVSPYNSMYYDTPEAKPSTILRRFCLNMSNIWKNESRVRHIDCFGGRCGGLQQNRPEGRANEQREPDSGQQGARDYRQGTD